MFEMHSAVRYSEVDGHGLLRPDAVIDYFQDCCTFQSETSGVGIAYTRSLGVAWILNYWHVEASRYPALSERICVRTYPYLFRGFMGLRSFEILAEDGESLIRADSVWSLFDLKKGAPVRVPDKILTAYAMDERLPMPELSRKLDLGSAADWQARDAEETIHITPSHLDSNGHVNNGQYCRFMVAALPEDKIPERLRLEYRRQAFLGDALERRSLMTPGEGTELKVLLGPPDQPYCAGEWVLRDRSKKEYDAF